ncbi:MAG: hypothetical protein ACSHX3_00935 [Litorimonas sp.]
MSQQPDSAIKLSRVHGRRRMAILGLAGLTALIIAIPSSTPWAGPGAIILLCIGLWGRSAEADTAYAPEHREPSLWDDGFGAI